MNKQISRLIILVAIALLVTRVNNRFDIFRLFANNSTAFAVGDLTIDWGVPSGQPIFVINNFLPGQKEIREVQVSNGASANRPVGIKGIKTSETGNLADALIITIFENGNIIFGPQNLASFFEESDRPTGIFLTNLAPTTSTKYNFEVAFDPESDNDFQNTSVVFDIIIGIFVPVPQECQGIKFSGTPIFGTQGNDNLKGSNGNDLIFGFEGNDKIDGSNGDDCLVGGPGNDIVEGSNGDDKIYGGEGNDIIDAGNGNDLIFGGPSNDTIRGGNGNEEIYGEEADDKLEGGNGNDILIGGEGEDSANGGLGKDKCEAETKIKCEN